jgi:hypothetical protein
MEIALTIREQEIRLVLIGMLILVSESCESRGAPLKEFGKEYWPPYFASCISTLLVPTNRRF